MILMIINFVLYFMVIFSGQSGIDIEDSNVWHSESTSSTSCAASSDDSSDDELIDIEDEDMKRPPFSVRVSQEFSHFI